MMGARFPNICHSIEMYLMLLLLLLQLLLSLYFLVLQRGSSVERQGQGEIVEFIRLVVQQDERRIGPIRPIRHIGKCPNRISFQLTFPLECVTRFLTLPAPACLPSFFSFLTCTSTQLCPCPPSDLPNSSLLASAFSTNDDDGVRQKREGRIKRRGKKKRAAENSIDQTEKLLLLLLPLDLNKRQSRVNKR